MSTNPVSYMVSQAGVSRAEFSAKHGFGKNLMTRLTQGRLQSVTPRIASALWSEWRERGIDQDLFDEEYDTLDVDTAYQRWVKNRRVANRLALPSQLENDTSITPFARLVRAIGSVSKTASVLVVADVVVQRFADGRQPSMPDSIREALNDMGYPHTAALEAAQKKWHESRA